MLSLQQSGSPHKLFVFQDGNEEEKISGREENRVARTKVEEIKKNQYQELAGETAQVGMSFQKSKQRQRKATHFRNYLERTIPVSFLISNLVDCLEKVLQLDEKLTNKFQMRSFIH